MKIITFFDDTTIDDFNYKGTKKTFKNRIKKLLLSNENYLDVLKENKTTFLDTYYKKDKKYNYNLLFSIDKNENELTVHIKLEKTINIKEQEREEKEKRRKELSKRIYLKNKQKKNKMTQREYLKKQKEEKKLMKNDDRVTDDMIKLYQKLKVSMPQAGFPGPVEILNNKDEHLKNFMKYVAMSKNFAGDDASKMMGLFNNDYVNYISSVLGYEPMPLVKSILDKLSKV